jgi:hypothetical protein
VTSLRATFALLLLMAGSGAAAESRDFGTHVVHYNAMPTNDLNGKMAEAYGLRREPGRIMLMVTVQRKGIGLPPTAVPARIKGSARDLLGNVQTLEFREVRNAPLIDYLAEIRAKHQDTQTFELTIVPEDGAVGLDLRFSQQFYVE